MNYVEGFLLPVPTAKREEYRQFAEKMADLFLKNGALNIVEGWGDDVPEGKLTSMPMAVKLEPEETVVFAWVVWASRAARDEGMKNMVAEHQMQPEPMPIPFDGKRMIFGRFGVIVDR